MSENNFIPLCVPEMSGGEWGFVKECLDTNWVSYVGSFVSRFEEDLAKATGAGQAVAMNSGTAALHVALRMVGVDHDQEVVMPALTFVAPANAVRYCGAWPSFVDVSPADWQLDVGKLEEFLRDGCVRRDGGLYNLKTGRKIAALLPVHLLGGMGDVDAILRIAGEFDLPIVEDAAEALGASYRSRSIGAVEPRELPKPRLVVTSFNGNKIITTGGGGAILANDAGLAERAKHLSTTAKSDPIEFDHDEVGYNYRLTNIAAAMGVAQLAVLGDYIESKRAIARRYQEALGGIDGVVCHPEPEQTQSTFWMYSMLVPTEARSIVRELNDQKIGSRPLWRLMNELPAFRDCHSDDLSGAIEIQRRGLSLPCSVGLEQQQQDRVIKALRNLL